MSDPNKGPGRREVPRPDQVTQVAPLGWKPGQPRPQSPQSDASTPPYGVPQQGAPRYGAPRYRTPPPQQRGAPPPRQYGAPQYSAPPPQQYGPPPPQQHGAPPPYGASQRGTPAAASDAPAPEGDEAARRPRTVTAAAVMAFVLAGIVILIYVLALVLVTAHSGSLLHRLGASMAAVVYLFLLTRLCTGVLFVWGGVAALRGRSRTLLVVVSGVEIVLALGGAALALGGVSRSSSGVPWFVRAVLDLLFVVPILILLFRPSSTNFFRARGGTTH
jgi:hypothetical protein